MISETKDSIANLTTVTGVTSVLMDWQLPLTIILILSGIILNIVRIKASTKNKKED